jgi:hypothetical protein
MIEYATELLVDEENDAKRDLMVARDALGRSWTSTPPELPFDQRWSFGLVLSANGEPLGYIHAEAARVFPVQPLDESWEEYQFGAVIDFPFVADSADYEHPCRALIDAALATLGERYALMPVYCLLPASSLRQTAILAASGFQSQDRTSLETELLGEHGFQAESARETLIYQRPVSPRAGQTESNPLRQLTGNASDLRIFSNAQTKIRLQPTLDFWGAIQLYTTYSAYPFIPQFLKRLQAQFHITPPRRLLVSPTAGGDFLRLWPLSTGHPSEAIGLDIRQDLVDLAELRTRYPEIDIINLALCELLHRVVMRNGEIDRQVHDDLAALCRSVQATRSEPAVLRFDDPQSLPLLARTFDEILQNRAIPDWFFPLKILASADPSTVDAGRADVFGRWLNRRAGVFPEVVRHLGALAFDINGTDIRKKYGQTNLGEAAKLQRADLMRDRTIPEGPFDLILCWEFIHVFHDREQLGQFIDSMLARLAAGGRLVITNIREPSAQTPHEQEWATDHLKVNRVDFKRGFIELSASGASSRVPFERRLHAHYPVLVVEPRSRG